MIDWTKTMKQTFEYYVVDPATWRDSKPLDNVKSATINRDKEAETLGSASFNITESVGEAYIRTYLIAIQNGEECKIPLGTHLVQTPSSTYNGKVLNVTMDAFTPLMEMKENQPPIGYYVPENTNIMEHSYQTVREQLRAPVIATNSEKTLGYDFVANTDDTWLNYERDIIGSIEYEFDLDEMGRVLYAPIQDTASLQPVWTYSDDNSSILYPEVTVDHDVYEIPNAVEIIYSDEKRSFYAKVVNDDENSPVSTVNRGREICRRITNPNFGGRTQREFDDYARRTLRELSTLEYKLTYTHGYCPVRLGDCVRLDYSSAGLVNVKARVVSQSIKCEPGCPVTETAVFTKKLWG